MKPDTRPGPVTAWNRQNRKETTDTLRREIELRRELEERGVLLPSRGRG